MINQTFPILNWGSKGDIRKVSLGLDHNWQNYDHLENLFGFALIKSHTVHILKTKDFVCTNNDQPFAVVYYTFQCQEV